MEKALGSNVVGFVSRRFSDTDVVLACENQPLIGTDLARRIARRQRDLLAANLPQGARLLVAGSRGNDVWIDMLAVWGLGLVAVPVERDPDPALFRAMLDRAEPAAVLGSISDPAAAALPVVEGGPDGSDETVTCLPVNRDDEAVMLFTSGSTGLPKAVPLTHHQLFLNARATLSVHPMVGGDRVFVAVPPRFVSALSHFLVTLAGGGAFLGTEGKPIGGDFVRAVEASGATAVGGSPRQLHWLSETKDLGALGLNWLMASGDRLPEAVMAAIAGHDRAPRVQVAYGLTELAGRFCMLPIDAAAERPGSVGRPIPGMALEIRDEGGRSLPAEAEGEVFARGACIFAGYLGEAPTDPEGGFPTGDIGRLDRDGFLYLSGRRDDVFKSGGSKVSTVAIAEALLQTGVFRDVAVIGVVHPVMGRVPYLYYALRPDRDFDKAAVMRWLRDRLPANHLPFKTIAVAEVPRTGSGKVDRGRLRALQETDTGVS